MKFVNPYAMSSTTTEQKYNVQSKFKDGRFILDKDKNGNDTNGNSKMAEKKAEPEKPVVKKQYGLSQAIVDSLMEDIEKVSGEAKKKAVALKKPGEKESINYFAGLIQKGKPTPAIKAEEKIEIVPPAFEAEVLPPLYDPVVSSEAGFRDLLKVVDTVPNAVPDNTPDVVLDVVPDTPAKIRSQKISFPRIHFPRIHFPRMFSSGVVPSGEVMQDPDLQQDPEFNQQKIVYNAIYEDTRGSSPSQHIPSSKPHRIITPKDITAAAVASIPIKKRVGDNDGDWKTFKPEPPPLHNIKIPQGIDMKLHAKMKEVERIYGNKH